MLYTNGVVCYCALWVYDTGGGGKGAAMYQHPTATHQAAIFASAGQYPIPVVSFHTTLQCHSANLAFGAFKSHHVIHKSRKFPYGWHAIYECLFSLVLGFAFSCCISNIESSIFVRQYCNKLVHPTAQEDSLWLN